MREEFHGDGISGGKRKQLYGWGTINANVWLPGLSELVGTMGEQYATTGVYYSAMQGLNTSTNPYTDAQGGNQFTYFKQYNTSGGGEKLWSCGGSEQYLLRSVRWDNATHAWMMRDATYFHTPICTSFLAVHPAAGDAAIKHQVVFLHVSGTIKKEVEYANLN